MLHIGAAHTMGNRQMVMVSGFVTALEAASNWVDADTAGMVRGNNGYCPITN